jgi:hypothetical protein
VSSLCMVKGQNQRLENDDPFEFTETLEILPLPGVLVPS